MPRRLTTTLLFLSLTATGFLGTGAFAQGADPTPIQLAPPGHELSPWSMFLGADILVKVVMVGLAFASLMTWTIFLAKIAELAIARRKLGHALAHLTRCGSLVEAAAMVGKRRNVLATFVRETAEEVRLSSGIDNTGGLQERVLSVHADVLRVEARGVRRGLGLLATIGSISPFVGLFGTVWGIMNSFIGISEGADHQSRGGGARHRGGAARDRDRTRCRHSGRDPVQSLRARHEGLPGAGRDAPRAPW